MELPHHHSNELLLMLQPGAEHQQMIQNVIRRGWQYHGMHRIKTDK